MQDRTPSKERAGRLDPRTPPSRASRNKSTQRFSGSRSRSGSPRKKPAKQPMHIRMNLTENQMDKITDAFTGRISVSPGKVRSNVRTQITQVKEESEVAEHGRPMTPFVASDREDKPTSSTFASLLHGHDDNSSKPNLAERRQRDPPVPLNFEDDRWPALPMPYRLQRETVPALESPLNLAPLDVDVVSPITPWAPRGQDNHGRRSPKKGQDGSTAARDSERIDSNVVRYYQEWAQNGTPFTASSADQSQSPVRPPKQLFANSDPFAGGTESSAPSQHVSGSVARPPPTGQYKSLICQSFAKTQESPLFSPLPLYFRSNDVPAVKVGEKVMIGRNGWLHETGEDATKTPPKKGGFFDLIKKLAKDMTDPSRRAQASIKEISGPNLRITLDAREQSLLYCELEFHLTSALNTFVGGELERGHLRPDKLKKIADTWEQQGRPRVVGFRYDLETQLELVTLHLSDFTFFGRRQGNPAEIAGVLHSMKTNARAMRVRTFCQPDSVIAKHIVDSRSLFNLLGVSTWQQTALGEIGQFFQLILERELKGGRTSTLLPAETTELARAK